MKLFSACARLVLGALFIAAPAFAGSFSGNDDITYSWGNTKHHVFAGDFNGDGKADIGVEGEGKWYIRFNIDGRKFSANDDIVYHWGNSSDRIFAGDFNGDGKADIGVMKDGKWYVRFNIDGRKFSGNDDIVFNWGNSVKNVFAGDFNGDGRCDIGVENPEKGTWYIRFNVEGRKFSANDDVVFKWGNTGHRVFVGDFNGDKLADIGCENPEKGTWYVRFNVEGRKFEANDDIVFAWGNSFHNVFAGDFSGDGVADIGCENPAKGYWYVRFAEVKKGQMKLKAE